LTRLQVVRYFVSFCSVASNSYSFQTGTKWPPERRAGNAKDEGEGAESETGNWEDVDGGAGEEWEDLSIPGSFS
jgi:hypothetical protein